jgi:hypothetical protein
LFRRRFGWRRTGALKHAKHRVRCAGEGVHDEREEERDERDPQEDLAMTGGVEAAPAKAAIAFMVSGTSWGTWMLMPIRRRRCGF